MDFSVLDLSSLTVRIPETFIDQSGAPLHETQEEKMYESSLNSLKYIFWNDSPYSTDLEKQYESSSSSHEDMFLDDAPDKLLYIDFSVPHCMDNHIKYHGIAISTNSYSDTVPLQNLMSAPGSTHDDNSVVRDIGAKLPLKQAQFDMQLKRMSTAKATVEPVEEALPCRESYFASPSIPTRSSKTLAPVRDISSSSLCDSHCQALTLASSNPSVLSSSLSSVRGFEGKAKGTESICMSEGGSKSMGNGDAAVKTPVESTLSWRKQHCSSGIENISNVRVDKGNVTDSDLGSRNPGKVQVLESPLEEERRTYFHQDQKIKSTNNRNGHSGPFLENTANKYLQIHAKSTTGSYCQSKTEDIFQHDTRGMSSTEFVSDTMQHCSRQCDVPADSVDAENRCGSDASVECLSYNDKVKSKLPTPSQSDDDASQKKNSETEEDVISILNLSSESFFTVSEASKSDNGSEPIKEELNVKDNSRESNDPDSDIEIIEIINVANIKKENPLDNSPGKPVKAYMLPFHSTNPEENRDNEDPNWSYLKALQTDAERYQYARECWRSPVVPDPNVSMTTFSYKWRHKIDRREILNRLANSGSGPRKRGLSDNGQLEGRPPSKRARRLNINFVHETVNNSIQTVRMQYFDRLNTAWHPNTQELLARRCQEKLEMLELAKAEVSAIHRFYEGLPDQNPGVSQLDIEQVHWDSRRVIEQFKYIYHWDGSLFHP